MGDRHQARAVGLWVTGTSISSAVAPAFGDVHAGSACHVLGNDVVDAPCRIENGQPQTRAEFGDRASVGTQRRRRT